MRNGQWLLLPGAMAAAGLAALASTAAAQRAREYRARKDQEMMEQDRTDGGAHAKPVTLRLAGDTHVGQKRKNNEDDFYMDTESRVFGVFDGMGGMAAGEEASRIAREQIERFFTEERWSSLEQAGDETVQARLDDALRAADTAIQEFAAQTPGNGGMGTTAVLAVRAGDCLHFANVGDSRGYLLRAGEPLQKLTQDHTVAAVLVELGEMTEEEAHDPGARNRLLASLGDLGKNKPAFGKVEPIQRGDRFLLCSDGLWDMLKTDAIEQLLRDAATPKAAVRHLIDTANEAGGDDNITAVVAFAE